MFQRIVVPLDGSARAEQAVPVAARIARSTGGQVLLLEVVNTPTDYSGGVIPAATEVLEEQVESEIPITQEYLKKMAGSPVLAGVETQAEVLYGLPAQSILGATRQGDLVVLCSHGRTGFARWALGSVAHTLVYQSAVPVLVLTQHEAFSLLEHRETDRPLRAFVPLDGSTFAETALSPAAHLMAALAAPAQGALHLVQVIQVAIERGEEGMTSAEKEEALVGAGSYLATTAERVQTSEKDLNLAITSKAVLGVDVAHTLLGLTEQEGSSTSNLIAISTHGRHGLEHRVMGSVTERVLTTTKLPMLIVPPQTMA
ncbi:MAG TPA: universal stress protein [Ktedonobacterales bacterium]|nr:universal stress protein [Ktedonobacterales bacterium]